VSTNDNLLQYISIPKTPPIPLPNLRKKRFLTTLLSSRRHIISSLPYYAQHKQQPNTNMESRNKQKDGFTHNVLYSLFIPLLNQGDTFDAFAEHVWWGGGGTGKCGQVELGDEKSLEGAIRSVPGTHEEVLKSEHGKFIQYTLKNNYIFPVNGHLGKVSFEKGDGGTNVTWFVQYTPKFGLNWLCLVMLSMLPMFLSHLEKKVSCSRKKSSGRSWVLWPLLMVCFIAVAGRFGNGVVERYRSLNQAVPLEPGGEYMAAIADFRRQTAALDRTIGSLSFLVIGASGFTGSALVDELLARGARSVRVLRRVGGTAGRRPSHPYPPARGGLRAEVWLGDVTDLGSLQTAMVGVDVVFHSAASYGTPPFTRMGAGEEAQALNVGGMRNVLQAARVSGVRQIVYTSSCDTAFTGRTALNLTETAGGGDGGYVYATGVDAVGDHYSRTKIEAERELLAASSASLSTVSLRPNGLYGPGENNNFPRAILPALMMGGMPFYFALEQHADWTCVYNLVFAHVLAVHHLTTDTDTQRRAEGDGNTSPSPSISTGGKAYFITDMESTGPRGELWGSANWGIFAPVLRRLGVSPLPLIRIPPTAFLLWTDLSEKAAFWIKSWTGIDLSSGLLTYKEALKVLTTHTHDCSAAGRDLGYYPVFSTSQCMYHTAEEFNRRYGGR
jgi:nucleoside-diphosphate-sugar epimerase